MIGTLVETLSFSTVDIHFYTIQFWNSWQNINCIGKVGAHGEVWGNRALQQSWLHVSHLETSETKKQAYPMEV